jgi:hypothetical protein
MIAGVETFVIRIWTPAERDDDPDRLRLRGLVQHIGSGEPDAFHGAGELLTLLNERIERKPQSRPVGRKPMEAGVR